jgi:hypothetical protein
VTPVLRILVAIGCGLALVAVSLIIVLKVRPTFVRRKRREAGDGMSSHAHRANSFAPGTHIPLSQVSISRISVSDETFSVNLLLHDFWLKFLAKPTNKIVSENYAQHS